MNYIKQLEKTVREQRVAKIQWLGNQVRAYSADSDRTLFCLSSSQPYLIKRLVSRAGKLGYIVPQIYPGNDGVVRIWL